MRNHVILKSTTALLIACSLGGCSKAVPEEVRVVLDANHADAVKAADAAVAICPAWKERSGVTGKIPIEVAPPTTDHPARGTSLESDGKIRDVYVSCTWPDPRSEGTESGLSIPALKGQNVSAQRRVTMPEDFAKNTCDEGVGDCERVIVPSRYAAEEASADLVIQRKLPDGGTALTTVVIVP